MQEQIHLHVVCYIIFAYTTMIEDLLIRPPTTPMTCQTTMMGNEPSKHGIYQKRHDNV